jgi:hypothetical protein
MRDWPDININITPVLNESQTKIARVENDHLIPEGSWIGAFSLSLKTKCLNEIGKERLNLPQKFSIHVKANPESVFFHHAQHDNRDSASSQFLSGTMFLI